MINLEEGLEKINNMNVEELEQLIRAALDESECTRGWSIEEGFEALRQFVEDGGFESFIEEDE